MLFATQNPPGLYGGRKMLSRAFRNRFIELKFDEIPTQELAKIINLRCQLAPSHCKLLVNVMQDLQVCVFIHYSLIAHFLIFIDSSESFWFVCGKRWLHYSARPLQMGRALSFGKSKMADIKMKFYLYL